MAAGTWGSAGTLISVNVQPGGRSENTVSLVSQLAAWGGLVTLEDGQQWGTLLQCRAGAEAVSGRDSDTVVVLMQNVRLTHLLPIS